MTARRCHGQSPLGALLACDLGEVGAGWGGHLFFAVRRRKRLDRRSAQEMSSQLRQRIHRVDIEPVDERRLVCVRGGNEGAAGAVVATDCDQCQRAANGANLPVEGELAHEDRITDRRFNLTARDHHPDGNREIVGGPLLAQVCGGKVHDDPAVEGPGERAVANCRTHALLRLLDGGVGQPDDGGRRVLSAGDIDLDLDHGSLEPHHRAGSHLREHPHSLQTRTWAEQLRRANATASVAVAHLGGPPQVVAAREVRRL